MFGYSREEMLKRPLSDLKPEGWKKQYSQGRINWELEQYGEQSFETVDVRKDGTELVVEVTNSHILEKDKKYTFSVVRDRTEPKKAQLELKRSEAIKQSIMDSTFGINIWAVDTKYCYTFFNKAHRKGMKEVWGADIEMGRCLLDYITDPAYREQVRSNYDSMFRGEANHSTDKLKTADGNYHYYENTGYPIYDDDGEVIGATFYTTDVTGRVELEKELKRTLALQESIMNSPPNVIIFSIDREYRYTFFNNAHKEAMRKIWGVEPCLGDNVLDLLPDREYKKAVQGGYDRVLDGGYISSIDELTDDKGNVRYFRNISAPVIDQKEDIIGLTLFILDVTEQKRAEEAMKESLHEKEILLKEVHHRVKNNLQIISSMLNMQIEMSKNRNVQFELREGQNRINTMALIHDQLYQSDNLAKIELEDYIRNLVSYVINTFRYYGANINTEFRLSHLHLHLDQAIPLGLIINELVSNAMKYAFAEKDEGTIIVSMEKNADSRLTFTVRDDGAGLPEGFEPDKLNTLGIQMIKALTQQLEGNFSIESDKGVRAVISFRTEDYQ